MSLMREVVISSGKGDPWGAPRLCRAINVQIGAGCAHVGGADAPAPWALRISPWIRQRLRVTCFVLKAELQSANGPSWRDLGVLIDCPRL